jgi:hypothetical protein
MVHQRSLAWYRHVALANQSRIRDGVMGGATWAGRDSRRTVADEAGDTMDTRGLERFRQGQGREDGGMVEGFPEV